MTAPVFVAEPGLLDAAAAGTSVDLDGTEARHAVTVARIGVGEQIALVDGVGRRVVGTVVTIDGPSSLTVLVEAVTDEPQRDPRITVIQALPKGDRGELAVELLTEVGVDEIVPWSAANCVAVWKGERAHKSHRRWADAARAAAKQSRRARFPVIASLASTGDVTSRIEATVAKPGGRAVVLHESAHESLSSAVDAAVELVLVVGPEGGITDVELTAFAHAGATIARLGPTVLRTSSAGMAAAAVVLSASSRWSSDASNGA